MHADLIVAADGVNSQIQSHVLDFDSRAIPNGVTNIRFTLPTSVIQDDPVSRKIMDDGDGAMVYYRSQSKEVALLRYPCREYVALMDPESNTANLSQ